MGHRVRRVYRARDAPEVVVYTSTTKHPNSGALGSGLAACPDGVGTASALPV